MMHCSEETRKWMTLISGNNKETFERTVPGFFTTMFERLNAPPPFFPMWRNQVEYVWTIINGFMSWLSSKNGTSDLKLICSNITKLIDLLEGGEWSHKFLMDKERSILLTENQRESIENYHSSASEFCMKHFEFSDDSFNLKNRLEYYPSSANFPGDSW